MSLLEYFKKKNNYAEQEYQPKSQDEQWISQLLQNIEADKRKYPDDGENIGKFAKILQAELRKHIKKRYPESDGIFSHTEPLAADSSAKIFLSEDHMCAYICLFPPLYGGRDTEFRKVLEDLHFDGISYGIDEEVLLDTIARKQYLHIVAAARGKAAEDGKDAVIESSFKNKKANCLECEEGTKIDFNETNLFQAVHQREIICRLTPATRGTDGFDVTGRPLRGKTGLNVHLSSGANTVLSQDGLFILAEIDGLVSLRNGLVCVDRQKVIFGSVDESVGDLDYPGNILIKGDVCERRTVKAAGNIIIEGEVRRAHIISGGSIRIQKGIRGGRSSSVQAAGQVQSKIIEETTVTAGKSIFAEVIKDSNITTAGSVYAENGRGLLIGGQIKTRYGVKALRIGNQSGCLNIIILNYNPELKNKVWTAQDEFDKTKKILEDLRKNTSALKSKFKTLLTDEKNLLTKLTEQRQLYEEQEEKEAAELAALKNELNDVSGCCVRSEEIYPTTIIRLGDKSLNIQVMQSHCNVHFVAGVLRER